MTRVGVVVGTFEYMAPEIVTEGGGSPGADRYALGIVAYQMLTGRVPFTGESAHSIMYRQVHDPPPAADAASARTCRPGRGRAAAPACQGAGRAVPLVPGVRGCAGRLASPASVSRPQATTIADITRPGFDRPTPGSGQTPLPRSGRVTRPVTAATLTPPAARALPTVPQAPAAPVPSQPQPREATAASALAPRAFAPGALTSATPARARGRLRR